MKKSEGFGPAVPEFKGILNSKGRKVLQDSITGEQFHEIPEAPLQQCVYELGSPVLPLASIIEIPIGTDPEKQGDRVPHSRQVSALKPGDTLSHEQYISLSGTIIAHALVFLDTDHFIVPAHKKGNDILIKQATNVGIGADGIPVLYDFGPSVYTWHSPLGTGAFRHAYSELEQWGRCDLSSSSLRDALHKLEALQAYYSDTDGLSHFTRATHRALRNSSVEERSNFLENLGRAIVLARYEISVAEERERFGGQ